MTEWWRGESLGGLNKEDWRKIAADLGKPTGERFERQWAEFQEFKEIVERQAAILDIAQGTAQFTAFGLAMLEAKEHGEFEAVENLVGP